MTTKTKIASGLAILSVLIITNLSQLAASGPTNPFDAPLSFAQITTELDTFPLQDRYGDYITDPNSNPFDIYPSEIEQTVEYDAESDSYVIYEKIGDEYFRTPTTMTFQEYIDWRAKQQEQKYFNKLAGIGDSYKSKSGRFDPMSKVDIEKNLVDRLFGGNGITIETQGTLDLNFGARYTTNESPYLLENQRTQWFFPDFGMDIQMNVDGKIGDKMDLGFNYDTNASFDFDRKIKLAYDSEKWTEDDIIKKIEAGNVSLPLRSSLIQGAQELFGLKTELQFGRLRLTGIMSQQRSEQESIQVQNGATVQEFELRPQDYDENRHFFISHYHRDVYEEALNNLPYINNSFRVTNIEVWISDDRPNFQTDQTMICGITDMAEANPDLLTSPNSSAIQIVTDPITVNKTTDARGNRLPENSVNTIYAKLISDSNADVKRVDNTQTVLTNRFGMVPGKDFDIFRGRKLTPNEYYFNPELGFISLNVKLRPNQVMSVGYEYFYTDNCEDVYKVGNTSDEGSVSNTDRSGQVQAEGVIFTKLIKPSTQRVDLPTWDLMMKNVYPLRANQLDESAFEFDIFYEDDGDGTLKKFLPIREGNFRFSPLLNLFSLDNLNRNNDPQPDGIFDFVPGVTVVPQNGSLIFPVLEPFGDAIEKVIVDELSTTQLSQSQIDSIAEFYSYHELYDTSVTIASFDLAQNKFVMQGKVKTTASSEYSLGAWNIPEGSVTVRAGSQTLLEGVDYEVDYGIGRVRIINQSIIQQGVPVNISFEDNSIFSLQQKNVMGLRAEYEINDNFYIGGTALRLAERPFTQKVNIGDDPIKNKVYGLDMDFNKESKWLTKMVDKLPFYSTNVASNINFSAEAAVLRPGHNKAINNTSDDESGGIVSLDDFEGAVSGFPLSSQPNRWTLASTPRTLDGRWPESQALNDIAYGANRARLAWYVIDRFVDIPESVKDANSFTRRVQQEELFRRSIPVGQLSDLFTFDLSYYPSERGPYNYDPPAGTRFSDGIELNDDGTDIQLKNPETRWAGIQRYLNNNDFEAANYEFIEFWVLNPFDQMPDGHPGHEADEEGYLTFHLGNVSEDVLYDNKQFYENSLPNEGVPVEFQSTVWGNVPLATPINDAFPGQSFADQDLGLDGLSDADERAKYENYLNSLQIAPLSLPRNVQDDPSADNYVYFNAPFFENNNDPSDDSDLLERYKLSNNPQGNSPDISSQQQFQRGNPVPDKEDLNNNRSLDSGESFHEYRIKFRNDGGQIERTDNDFIRDTRVIRGPNDRDEIWYRFRVPLNSSDKINGITGFRSIQFIRMLVNGFATPKTFRLAEFELVRNQWRKLNACCNADLIVGSNVDSLNTIKESQQKLSVDVVGFEENRDKTPFPYQIPRGIQQERVFSNLSPIFQDENSLVMKYDNLQPQCEVKIAKLTELDLRVFDKLQLFVHSEACIDDADHESKDISVFIRVGKDFERHYYEYEIPMQLSDPDEPDLLEQVWPEVNKFNFPLDLFIQTKKIRNVLRNTRIDSVFQLDSEILEFPEIQAAIAEYTSIDDISIPEDHRVRIVGNPNLGLVKGIAIGVRNRAVDKGTPRCGEVWLNELRVEGLQERPGAAGLARLDIQLADLGNLTASTSYSSIGWGALDDRVNERQKEELIEYDVATNLELGKFFPKNWNMKVPFYAQYAKSIVNPEFDAYDLDITREDEVDLFKNRTPEEQLDVRERSQKVNTIKTFNFTNVRKERSTGGNNASKSAPRRGSQNKTQQQTQTTKKERKKNRKPMPWDISNLSATYSYTKSTYRDNILIADNSVNQIFGLDYTYSRRGNGITPFKKLVKSKALKIIKEFNFNPVPNSFAFNSTMNRFESTRRYRLPIEPIYEFDDRKFDWIRSYDLNWNLTKALKINYSAQNTSYIDEARQSGISDTPQNRDWFAFRDNDGDGFLEQTDVTSDVAADPNFVDNYWKDNLRSGGRNTDYGHNFSANYTVPTKLIPYMDWIDIKAQYRADYSWAAGALIKDFGGFPLAGVIQNSQNRSITANLNFDKLYKKSKYLTNLDRTSKSKSRKRLKGDGDKVTVSKDGQGRTTARKKSRQPGVAEKLLLRPFFMLRGVRLTYKEDFSTILPGFTGTPEYLGLDDSFTNPGLGFVFGIQPDINPDNPDNFLDKAVANGWITESSGLNQELIQSESQNIEAKIKIEPWKDFKVDVDFKKSYRSTHNEVFKNVNKNGVEAFQGLAARDMGSFDMTFFNMNTLFGTSIDELFDTFEGYRPIISARLPNLPGVDIHTEDGVDYQQGYGKQSSSVLVPAFLAAYTDKDPNTIELDLDQAVRKRTYVPKPNWNLRYDGLTKLPWFKDRFSSFTLEHAYSSRLRVASFNTDVEYDRTDPFGTLDEPKLRENGNYYTRIEIPAIQISENFNPIIGLRMKTRSEFTLEFEYIKSRDLNLKINTSSQLEEDKKTGFVFGMGYTIKDSKFLKKNKRGSRNGRTSRSSRDDKDKDDKKKKIGTGGSVTSDRGSDMTFMLNLSWNDNQFFVHELDTNKIQEDNETRGDRGFQISPSVDYNLNENVTLRAFFDYNTNTPYGSTNFKRTNVAGGITMSLSLN